VLAVAARAEAKAARLAAAADRADRESRIKSDFLASMSHELRTPLNAVLGFVEILRSELFGPIDNPRYRGYLADIQRAAQHLLSVINDVLDLGRLEAGVARPEIAQVELDQVAESAVAMVRARIALNRAALAEGAPTIRSDGRLIRQILLNLLGNAVKFTPSGGSVSLSLEAADDAVRLVVADTGPGMTAEEVSTALAPYGQIERISARSAAGTGLGLPIAERLARILGGGLEIESALGTGTRVTVTLPRTPKAA
jgi:two-component system, cell cycle sensor histidine kinase PleC